MCGHRESEHLAYDWSPGRSHCRGYVTAYDSDSEGHVSDHRHAGCSCTNFYPADEHQLAEWREMGNLREVAA